MKILLFACVITLLTTTGCFLPGGGRGWHDHRADNVVATPEIAVAAPEIGVRPPETASATTNAIVPPPAVLVLVSTTLAP